MSAPVQIGTEMGPKFKSNLFGQQPSTRNQLIRNEYLALRIGVPEGNRTPDPRFRKPVLYPAELPGRLRPPAAAAGAPRSGPLGPRAVTARREGAKSRLATAKRL